MTLQTLDRFRRIWMLTLLLGAGLQASAESGHALKQAPKGAKPIPMESYDFDHDAAGKPPERFTLAVTGEGPDFVWEVSADHTAPSRPNVLVQSGTAGPGDNIALALLEGTTRQNGEASVKFKLMSGEEDQSAGIVWRVQDPQTYYMVLASAVTEDCSIYCVRKGKLKLIDSQSVIVSPYLWHELRIVFVNGSYTAFVDKEVVVGGKDAKIPGPGRIGLCTKSDSVARFDDFRVSK